MASTHHAPLFDGLDATHFQALQIPTIISASTVPTCDAYAQEFLKAAKAAESSDPKAARAMRALQCVCMLQLRLDDRRQPLVGWSPMDGWQMPGPDDFGPPLLAILANLAQSASDPELKSRLADLCWSTQKPRAFAMAQTAVAEYLASAANLYPPPNAQGVVRRWDEAVQRLQRALYIATSTKHQALIASVQAAFDAFLRNHADSAPALELGRLLTDYQNELSGDIPTLIATTERCAARAAQEGKWGSCRHLHRIQANWQKLAEMPDAAQKTEEQRAETFVLEAQTNPTSAGKARILLRAIDAYRHCAPRSPRIAAIKQQMEELQRAGVAEMQTISYPLGDAVDPSRAANHVSGLPFEDAVGRLAGILLPLSEAELEKFVLERCKSPWFAMAPADLIDWDGRIIARRGELISDNPEVQKHAIRAEMFRAAIQCAQVHVGGYIEPARLQILAEHNPTYHDLYSLLVDSPFVPASREQFFLRGLYEGLVGDFLIAAHLLIPQLEHALRYQLSLRGIDVVGLNSDGIQEVFDLNKLFSIRRDALTRVFGQDQVFELECLLVRRYGANLRNSFAHGLFTPDQFFDSSVRYLWWVTLRLCMYRVPDIDPDPTPTTS